MKLFGDIMSFTLSAIVVFVICSWFAPNVTQRVTRWVIQTVGSWQGKGDAILGPAIPIY